MFGLSLSVRQTIETNSLDLERGSPGIAYLKMSCLSPIVGLDAFLVHTFFLRVLSVHRVFNFHFSPSHRLSLLFFPDRKWIWEEDFFPLFSSLQLPSGYYFVPS